MSSVKLLNLDELTVVKRVIMIGGAEYPVAEQTLGEMLSRIQLSKTANSDSSSPEGILGSLKETARQILPTAPERVIESLTVEKIVKLIEFVNESDTELAAKAEGLAEETAQAQETDGKK